MPHNGVSATGEDGVADAAKTETTDRLTLRNTGLGSAGVLEDLLAEGNVVQ